MASATSVRSRPVVPPSLFYSLRPSLIYSLAPTPPAPQPRSLNVGECVVLARFGVINTSQSDGFICKTYQLFSVLFTGNHRIKDSRVLTLTRC